MRALEPGLRSRTGAILAVVAAAALGCAPNTQADTIRTEPRPAATATSLEVWVDRRRGREIPVKIYRPAERAGDPPPVVIFSHGLGGSREGSAYLGERWAAEGFLAVFIQHPGSDESLWRGLPPGEARRAMAAGANPRAAVDRFTDLPFVVDEIERRVADGRLRADTGKIGLVGHSFGAHSVLAALGRAYPTPQGVVSFADPRIKAGVALSPPGPAPGDTDLKLIYGPIRTPILHVTGTADDDPLRGVAPPESRLTPFKHIDAPQILVVFEGGDHMVFSGRGFAGAATPAWYPAVQQDTADLSVLFLRAVLLSDEAARAKLASPDLAKSLRHPARIETKTAKAAR